MHHRWVCWCKCITLFFVHNDGIEVWALCVVAEVHEVLSWSLRRNFRPDRAPRQGTQTEPFAWLRSVWRDWGMPYNIKMNLVHNCFGQTHSDKWLLKLLGLVMQFRLVKQYSTQNRTGSPLFIYGMLPFCRPWYLQRVFDSAVKHVVLQTICKHHRPLLTQCTISRSCPLAWQRWWVGLAAWLSLFTAVALSPKATSGAVDGPRLNKSPISCP